MAMIDYGALVIKNGVPINKNKDLFMECPNYFDEEIKDNYFVYCGDEEYSLCFYKCMIVETRNGHCAKEFWNFPFKSETFYRDGINITVKRLDNLYPKYEEHWFGAKCWEDYVRENWVDALGTEKINELSHGKAEYKLWMKQCKRIGRKKPIWYNSTLKYVATWEYKGDKWEVIFGYGVDNNEDTFNYIVEHNTHNYKPNSIKYIRENFFER